MADVMCYMLSYKGALGYITEKMKGKHREIEIVGKARAAYLQENWRKLNYLLENLPSFQGKYINLQMLKKELKKRGIKFEHMNKFQYVIDEAIENAIYIAEDIEAVNMAELVDECFSKLIDAIDAEHTIITVRARKRIKRYKQYKG